LIATKYSEGTDKEGGGRKCCTLRQARNRVLRAVPEQVESLRVRVRDQGNKESLVVSVY